MYYMQRRPQDSTRFPYTTLFRSVIGLEETGALRSFRNIKRVRVAEVSQIGVADVIGAASLIVSEEALARSEEHTSELQSLAYLVCRLLPEKKKTINNARCRQASH